MTDLAVIEARPSAVVPANEWLLITRQAEALAQSDIIPMAYRRKPANIVAAALAGRTFGWDVMQAVRQGHVIEGVWTMRPEAMLGLVRRAGHGVDIELIEDGPVEARGAVVTAHREGEGDMVVRFTIGMGVEKGLVQIKDGKPWARSSSGKPLPWQQYPVDMCMWRAVGKACRAKYSDITGGFYVAEELGASLDADGEVVDLGEIDAGPKAPAPLSDAVIEQFGKACATEGLNTAEVLARAFPDGPPDPLTDAHLPHLRDTFRALVEARVTEVVDAEIVEEDGHFVNDEMAGGTKGADDSVPSDPDGVRPATRNQVGKIKGEYDRLGQRDRDKQLMFTSDLVGRKVPSHNALTHDEASRVIEHLVSLPVA